MKKMLFLTLIVLVFAAVLTAEAATREAPVPRHGISESARFNRLDNTTAGSFTPVERPVAEKCANCPQEKPEGYVCTNEVEGKNCCKDKDETNPQSFRRGKRGDFSGKLNLTDAQKQRIDTLNANHLKANEKRRADLVKLQNDKWEAIKNNKPKDAKKLVDRISKIQSELEKSRVDLMINISNELTPEQKEMLNKPKTNKPEGKRGK